MAEEKINQGTPDEPIVQLREALNKYPNLTVKNYLKAYRYNLHLRKRSLLIELGNQNNSIEEAKKILKRFIGEEYIEKIKREEPNQFVCGRYEVGRYAWVLEDVEILEKDICETFRSRCAAAIY